MNRFNKLFHSDSSNYQTFFFAQENNKFHILHSFCKNHEIVVSKRYHEKADKNFLRNCQYVGKETKRYRHIFKKWYVYKLPAGVFNYNPLIYDFYAPKNTIADVFQIDDVIISFKGIFDKVNDLSKPSTDIWNNNKKTYLEGTVKASSTNVCRICLGKLQKKLLSDFIRESYF